MGIRFREIRESQKVPVLRQCSLLATQTQNPGESLDFSIGCIASSILGSFVLAMQIQNMSRIHGFTDSIAQPPSSCWSQYILHARAQTRVVITSLPEFLSTFAVPSSYFPPIARQGSSIICTPYHHPAFLDDIGVFWATGGRRQSSLLVVRRP